MNTQSNAAPTSIQQNFAAAEYICTVLENGVVIFEETDCIELDFGYDSY